MYHTRRHCERRVRAREIIIFYMTSRESSFRNSSSFSLIPYTVHSKPYVRSLVKTRSFVCIYIVYAIRHRTLLFALFVFFSVVDVAARFHHPLLLTLSYDSISVLQLHAAQKSVIVKTSKSYRKNTTLEKMCVNFRTKENTP